MNEVSYSGGNNHSYICNCIIFILLRNPSYVGNYSVCIVVSYNCCVTIVMHVTMVSLLLCYYGVSLLVYK
jgi:hypothetical protein